MLPAERAVHNNDCMLSADHPPVSDPVCTCEIEHGRLLSMKEGWAYYDKLRGDQPLDPRRVVHRLVREVLPS